MVVGVGLGGWWFFRRRAPGGHQKPDGGASGGGWASAIAGHWFRRLRLRRVPDRAAHARRRKNPHPPQLVDLRSRTAGRVLSGRSSDRCRSGRCSSTGDIPWRVVVHEDAQGESRDTGATYAAGRPRPHPAGDPRPPLSRPKGLINGRRAGEDGTDAPQLLRARSCRRIMASASPLVIPRSSRIRTEYLIRILMNGASSPLSRRSPSNSDLSSASW